MSSRPSVRRTLSLAAVLAVLASLGGPALAADHAAVSVGKLRPAAITPKQMSPAQLARLATLQRNAATRADAASTTRALRPAILSNGVPEFGWSDGNRALHNTTTGYAPLLASATRSFDWAPDGSRYAFGNSTNLLQTAHADGSGVVTADTLNGWLADISYVQGGQILATTNTSNLGTLRISDTVGAYNKIIGVSAVVPVHDLDFLDFTHLVVSGGGAAAAGDQRLFTLTLDLNNGTATATPLTPSDPGASTPGTSLVDVAVSPDRTKIAYVEVTETTQQLWVADLNGANAHLITGAYLRGGPVFSLDGSLVYQASVDSGTGLVGIRSWPADGSGSATVLVPDAGGDVNNLSVRPDPTSITPDRLAGTDRIGTAVAVSQYAWVDKGTQTSCDKWAAQSVVLARSDLFPDALSAGPLAAAKCGPLLITKPTSLDSRVAAEIQRILPAGRTVYLAGSTGALSAGVETALKGMGYTTVRLAGADRFATSVAIAKALQPTNTTNTFLFATGRNFPDALSAGPAAAVNGYAILLTSDTVMPAAVINYINSFPAGVFGYAVGKQAATAAPWATPLWGADRYATNIAVNRAIFYPPYAVGIATGQNFPDALAGGAFQGIIGQPLILTPGSSVPAVTSSYLDASSASEDFVIVYGGTSVVTDPVVNSVVALAGGRIPL